MQYKITNKNAEVVKSHYKTIKILKRIRKDSNYTQEKIARIAGINQPAISRFENGKLDSAYILQVYMYLFNLKITKRSMNDGKKKNKT